MKAKTIRLTVLCPCCQTAYTFKSEDKWKAFMASDRTAPLHTACKEITK